jgi:hypothetical protein
MLTAAFETPARSATSASVVRRPGCGDMILLDREVLNWFSTLPILVYFMLRCLC